MSKNVKKSGFLCSVILALVKIGMYILYRPKIIYADKSLKSYAKEKPCIFVSNHSSHADGLFAGAVLGSFKPYSLVAKDWYDKKGMGFFLKHTRTIPIDRYKPDADWYILGQEVINGGGSMLIFPAGNTSSKEFKPGAALLASKTGADIIPCAIVGGYHKLFGQRQRMIIGKPVRMHCPDNMRHSQFAKQQTALIQKEVEALRQHCAKTD